MPVYSDVSPGKKKTRISQHFVSFLWTDFCCYLPPGFVVCISKKRSRDIVCYQLLLRRKFRTAETYKSRKVVLWNSAPYDYFKLSLSQTAKGSTD